MKARIIPALAVFWGVAGFVTGQEKGTPGIDGAIVRAEIVGEAKINAAAVEKAKPAGPRRSGDLIHVTTRISTETPGPDGSPRTGPAEESTLIIEAGTWASFETVTEIRYPTEYDPPKLPEQLADQLHGGGFIDEKKAADLATNPTSYLIPSFPRNFETRDIGLTVKLRPRVAKGGAIQIDYDIEHSVFNGFVDYGTPVTKEKTRPGGKAKSVLLMGNQILMPMFQVHRDRFTLPEAGRDFHSMTGNARPTAEDGTPVEFAPVALDLADPFLPGLQIQFQAKKIETGLEPAAIDATEERRQIFVTSKFIESSERLDLAGLPGFKPVMSDPEYQMFIRALNQKRGIDILSAPSILMRNGQEGVIEVVQEMIFPKEFDPPQVLPSNTDRSAIPTEGDSGKRGAVESFPLTPSAPNAFETRTTGVRLGIVPKILGDGSLEIEATPQIVHFLEHINFGEPILQPHYGLLGKYQPICISENRMEMPVFRRDSLKTRVRIPNGKSIVLGGFVKETIQDVQEKVPVLGDLPLIGRAARREYEVHSKRYTYVVITASLVDPAGVPVARLD